MHTGGGDRLKLAIFATFEPPWPWPWIRPHSTPRVSLITHKPISTHQIPFKMEKTFWGQVAVIHTYGIDVCKDRQTYIETFIKTQNCRQPCYIPLYITQITSKNDCIGRVELQMFNSPW